MLDRRHAVLGLAKAAAAIEREAWFEHSAAITVSVVARTELSATFAGPLIVEAYDTTVVVPPGWRGSADSLGNLLLEPS